MASSSFIPTTIDADDQLLRTDTLHEAMKRESIRRLGKSQVIRRTGQGDGLTNAGTVLTGSAFTVAARDAGNAEVSPDPEHGTGQWTRGAVTYGGGLV